MSILTPGLQAVLFDLDGVIIDSEPLHVKALQSTCDRFGFTLLPEDVVRFKGITETQVAQHYLDGQATLTVQDFVTHKSEVYTRLVERELVLIDGVLDFMQFCRARHWRLGLTTSALRGNAATVLKKFHLESGFEVIVTGGDVKQGKPHPEPYLITAQKLGLHPAACLVIEDSINGVRSAKAAGCLVLGITTSFARHELDAAGANWVVDSFAEARQLVFGQDLQD